MTTLIGSEDDERMPIISLDDDQFTHEQDHQQTKLPSSGTGNAVSTLSKRQREWAVDEETHCSSSSSNSHNNIKKQKALTDDLICPITFELPFDPVTAEDGRIYERRAIEMHIRLRKNQGGSTCLRSPVTNQVMGDRILPAPQHKNIIQTLIDSNMITGDLQNQWNQRVQAKQVEDDLLKRANSGDYEAMYEMADIYCYRAFSRNDDIILEEECLLALALLEKIRDCRDADFRQSATYAEALADLALVLFCGSHHESSSSVSKGIMYLTEAAIRGADSAAHHLGCIYAEGKYGVLIDTQEAQRFLEMALYECRFQLMDEEERTAAERLLGELTTAVTTKKNAC